MRERALEQRDAEAKAAVLRQNREPELGLVAFEGHMRHANQHEPIVVNAENCVAIEVDSVDVGGDDSWRQRRAEPQAPILHGQREKVCGDRGACAVTQTMDGDTHERASRSIARLARSLGCGPRRGS